MISILTCDGVLASPSANSTLDRLYRRTVSRVKEPAKRRLRQHHANAAVQSIGRMRDGAH